MSLLDPLLDVLYPRFCGACGGNVGEGGHYLCWDCRSGLEFITDPYCEVCGDPVDGVVGQRYTCGWCVRDRVWFDRARSALRYRGPLRPMLHAFKYVNGTHLSRDCVAMLKACVDTHFGDVFLDAVTPVPLHSRRYRARTYNQSALLARGLASSLDLEYLPRCLARVRDTSTQTNLTASQRRANVRGAFEARQHSWIDGRTILLIDDVMTTGATVSECSRVLKEAGAAGVYVVTVARG